MLSLNFEKLQIDIEDSYVKKLITSLMHYISVRLKLIGLYVKLREVGSSNNYINYGELQELIEKIPIKFSTPSPISGILKILQ